MIKVYEANTAEDKPDKAPEAGKTSGWFTGESSNLATVIPCWWLNMVQAEILSALFACGEIEPNDEDDAQLGACFDTKISKYGDRFLPGLKATPDNSSNWIIDTTNNVFRIYRNGTSTITGTLYLPIEGIVGSKIEKIKLFFCPGVMNSNVSIEFKKRQIDALSEVEIKALSADLTEDDDNFDPELEPTTAQLIETNYIYYLKITATHNANGYLLFYGAKVTYIK